MAYPGLSLRSNPGLKLANAFGVIIPERLVSDQHAVSARFLTPMVGPGRVGFLHH